MESAHTTMALKMVTKTWLSLRSPHKLLMVTMSTANALTTNTSVSSATRIISSTWKGTAFRWPRLIVRTLWMEFVSNAYKATTSIRCQIVLSCRQTVQKLMKWECVPSVLSPLFWFNQANVCHKSWTAPSILPKACVNSVITDSMLLVLNNAKCYPKIVLLPIWLGNALHVNKATF